MVALIDLSMREQTPDDLAIHVDIENRSIAPVWQNTVDEARWFEGLARPEPKPLRLLALVGDEPVGTGAVRRMVWDREGRMSVGIAVVPEFRRRGIGRALYERLETYVREQGAREISAFVAEDWLPLAGAWLEREGYTEAERMRMSEQSLDTFDPDAYAAAEAKATAAGITFTTLAEADTEENRRKLWEVNSVADRDVPTTSHEDTPFEEFQQQLDRPECLRDCLVIARHGDDYVGYTILSHRRPERAFIEMTGVHPDWRNHGIATAVKVRSALLARAKGYKAIRTFNHVNNPAMLAVNRRLGYQPLPEGIIFVKTLEP